MYVRMCILCLKINVPFSFRQIVASSEILFSYGTTSGLVWVVGIRPIVRMWDLGLWGGGDLRQGLSAGS